VRAQRVQGRGRDFSATISLELLEVVVIVGVAISPVLYIAVEFPDT